MKYYKYLAMLAAMMFGLAALASAQEGYYGQQGAAPPAAQSNSGNVTIGRTGHITLTHETIVGSTVLPSGDYEVRHRRSANGHFVEVTRILENYTGPQQGQSPEDWEVVAEVPCTMQSLNAPVRRTFAETSTGVVAHLISLRIRGESVVHVFQAGPDPSAPQNQIEYGGGGM